jgi:glycosyltransferase involved in cell wall biosynthesis
MTTSSEVAASRKPRQASSVARRPTLLVISQVYPPDPTAVGQYFAEAAEEAVRRGWRAIVYTASRGYDDPRVRFAWREVRNGVEVRRLPFSSFGKSSLAIRLVAQTLFLLQATVRALFVGQLRAVLVSTSPPFTGPAGVVIAKIRGARLLWWVMDLNPDQLVAAGRARPGALAVRIFDWLNRVTLSHAEVIVALDDFMRQRLLAKLPVPEKMHVIPPWPLDGVTADQSEGGRTFRRRHEIDGKFVVMYAGNHSPQNPLDTLLAAAGNLCDRQDIHFVFVGGGGGKKAVEDLAESLPGTALSLPYQPRDRLHETLAAADLHVVSIGDPMIGILHPCKIYTAMQVGKPILVIGSKKSPAGQIVTTHGLGWCVEHGDVAGAENVIRHARDAGRPALQEMGGRAAALAAERYSREVLLDRLSGLLLGHAAESR